MVTDRRERLLKSTSVVASHTTNALKSQLDLQIGNLQLVGDLSSMLVSRSQEEWQSLLDNRVDRLPGLDYVAWQTGGQRLRWVVAEEQTRPQEIDDLKGLPADLKEPHVLAPERDESGDYSYWVVLPVHSTERKTGRLAARFAVEPFLKSTLRARAVGYALVVGWNGEPIYSRGTPSIDPSQGWWSVTETVSLPHGGAWMLTLRPTKSLATRQLTPLPHYLLAAGLLLSVGSAIVAHQLRIILQQSRFLAATNLALEDRGAELESKIAERTASLEDAVGDLKAFNYTVSHDLRSPLSAILNFEAIFVEDYENKVVDAEGLEMLGRIRRSALRATDLLESLLQFSRLGSEALAREPVDMTEVARGAFVHARSAEELEEQSDVELSIEELPEAIGDQTLLANVFVNLFSNAIKYTRGCDERKITVSGRIEEDRCLYEVSDTGRGFEDRFAAKMFELFERIDPADRAKGAGVGLAVVARIIKRHGGRVWAVGRPGAGARFSFTVPRGQSS